MITHTHSRRVVIMTVTMALFLAATVSCQSAITPREHAERYPLFDAMRAELQPYQPGVEVEAPVIRRYYRSSLAGIPDGQHLPVSFPFKGDRMALHLYFPDGDTAGSFPADMPGQAGTVIILHGYLSHALDHAALIRGFLERDYVVVVPELPGHGLSGGVRGGIDSFGDYGSFLDTLIEVIGPDMPTPWHIIGHSTGALSIFEYLRRGNDPFDAVVFAAPLVRSWMYNPARLGRFLTRPFVTTVATQYDSPLGVHRMPLDWFDAQVEWNRRIENFLETHPPITREILVLQGNRDRVVAWRYNRRIIERAFTRVDYRILPGESHVLYQDDARNRQKALDMTFRYIQQNGER
jgi:alpha-beta hydrolase superfamily lysophospholipase